MNAELYKVPLVQPFRIAHGSSTHRVMLRVEHDGVQAEAPFVPYYVDDPLEALEVVERMRSPDDELQSEAPRQARLVMDMLRHNLRARDAGVPVWSHLNLPNPNGIRCCKSIGIPDDLMKFQDQVAEMAQQFSVIKLKLGSGLLHRDETIVRLAREAAPDVTFIADANGGWLPLQAARILPVLGSMGLQAIEQPVSHRGGIKLWRKLRRTLKDEPVPTLLADESAHTAEDVSALAGLADGVNVKLLKCGGITNALRMIETARALGMKVMLGCMIETQVGIAYAAQLAGLADWVDLDGHLFLPHEGPDRVRFDQNGALRLPESGAFFANG